jgi:AcrR family transcriptional regulator
MSIAVVHKNAKRGSTVKPGTESAGSCEKVTPRDRIVTSACELFRQHGIRGIGVDAIAEAASTNKMTLYRHFGSKDDLVCETLRVTSEKSDAMWTDIETRFPGDAKAQLEGWVMALSECLLREPFGCEIANAAVELKDAGHPAHAVIEAFKIVQRGRLTDLCASAGIKEPGVLADTLLLLLEGARVSRQASGAAGPSQSFQRACRNTLVAFGVSAA